MAGAPKAVGFEYNQGIKRLKAAAVIQYTLPGVPSLFYGDEAGVQGYGDPFCRATYPWGNENADLVDFYKTLGNVRKDCKAFVDGDFYTVFANVNAIAYTRTNAKGAAFIAVNRGSEAVSIEIPDQFKNAKTFGCENKYGTVTLGENEYTIIYK